MNYSDSHHHIVETKIFDDVLEFIEVDEGIKVYKFSDYTDLQGDIRHMYAISNLSFEDLTKSQPMDNDDLIIFAWNKKDGWDSKFVHIHSDILTTFQSQTCEDLNW